MGYIRHHAIVVTSYQEIDINSALNKAISLGMRATGVVGPTNNDTWSFLVAPDGSKEGWADSNKGDGQRESFKAWLRTSELKGPFHAHWVEVQYGDDNGITAIVDHSDDT